MTDSENLISMLVQRLNFAVLIRKNDREFEPIGDLPHWFETVFGVTADLGENAPFLEGFLDQAIEEYWPDEALMEPLISGMWEANIEEGSEVPRYYEASALKNEGNELLLIEAVDDRHRQEQIFVQRNHEQVLDRHQLMKEQEKKQILLDCIMHDLANPLSIVMLNLQHLTRSLPEGDKKLHTPIERALKQAKRQKTLIHSVRDVFAADLAAIHTPVEGVDAPDLSKVATETIAACSQAAQEKKVTLCPLFSGKCLIKGEPLYLSRIIENLLVNAIRYSPEGGKILISLEEESDFGTLIIDDEGTGFEGDPEWLFQPFAQGSDNGGQSGLGLYFCKMTVEMWGGSIQASNRDEGGARFQFRLPKVG